MATQFTNGLRALRIPTLRLCRPRVAAYSCSLLPLRRQLSTSIPRFTPLAQSALLTDVSKPVAAVEEEVDEPVPFSALEGKVSRETLKAITVRPMKHTLMTPVQEAVLSMLPELTEPLKKKEDGSSEESSTPRDLMVRAKTGTGKTLAFLVPAIESRVKAIEEAGREAQARAGRASDTRLVETAKRTFAHTHIGTLILCPTRELAQQIKDEAVRLSTHHDFYVHMLRGGDSKSQQLHEWRNNRKDIVVATTGRLRDLMNTSRNVLESLKTVKLLILDEADTMLDMGFRPDIDAITDELPRTPERQTFIFSATISQRIQEIAPEVLDKNYVFINTVSQEDSPVHAHIAQYHTVLSSAADQLPHVLRLLAHDQLTNPGKSKVIVFLPTTRLTQLYTTFIRSLAPSVLPAGRNTTVYELHSKLTMGRRSKTSDSFRHDTSGACVLVTSDVSARGVDYPGVTRIVQLGIPASGDQYIHRIGRTGRAGSQGRGDLVLLPWEHGFIRGHLSHVPLKPVTSHDLEKQVHEIAERHDKDPAAFFPVVDAPASKSKPRRWSDRRGPVARYPGQVAARLRAVKEEIDEVLSSVIEEEEVRETFASLLGFYVSRNDLLRTSRDTILEGLRDWTVQAAGLPEPPYVSEAFLNKIGFVMDRRNTRTIERKHLRGNPRAERQVNRWDGRGTRKSKLNRAIEAREMREADAAKRRDSWPPRRGSDSEHEYRERRRDSYDGERGSRDRRRDSSNDDRGSPRSSWPRTRSD